MNMHSPIGQNNRVKDWSNADIDLLCQLWGKRTVVKEIAKRLHRTAGAVTSKAHRIKLPQRRIGDKRVCGGIYFPRSLADKIQHNASTLGIAKSEYIRRCCDRCPLELIGE